MLCGAFLGLGAVLSFYHTFINTDNPLPAHSLCRRLRVATPQTNQPTTHTHTHNPLNHSFHQPHTSSQPTHPHPLNQPTTHPHSCCCCCAQGTAHHQVQAGLWLTAIHGHYGKQQYLVAGMIDRAEEPLVSSPLCVLGVVKRRGMDVCGSRSTSMCHLTLVGITLTLNTRSHSFPHTGRHCAHHSLCRVHC